MRHVVQEDLLSLWWQLSILWLSVGSLQTNNLSFVRLPEKRNDKAMTHMQAKNGETKVSPINEPIMVLVEVFRNIPCEDSGPWCYFQWRHVHGWLLCPETIESKGMSPNMSSVLEAGVERKKSLNYYGGSVREFVIHVWQRTVHETLHDRKTHKHTHTTLFWVCISFSGVLVWAVLSQASIRWQLFLPDTSNKHSHFIMSQMQLI